MNPSRRFLSNKIVSLYLIWTAVCYFTLSDLSSFAQERSAPPRVSDRNGPTRNPSAGRGPSQNPNARKSSDKRGVKTNPRDEKNGTLQIKERRSENPVRFVFAPKNRPTQTEPWNQDPSAAAIWSTFLTGSISPELVEWHVNQRKKVQYEKVLAARGQKPNSESGNRALASDSSEYGRMLNRMEFSLAARNGIREGDETADPSGGAILLQLLTGYKNMELQGWKENQIASAQNRQRLDSIGEEWSEEADGADFDPQMAAVSGSVPRYIAMTPNVLTPPMMTPAAISYNGHHYVLMTPNAVTTPQNGSMAPLSTTSTASPTAIPTIPRAAPRVTAEAPIPASETEMKTEMKTKADGSVIMAGVQESRFVDDHFPTTRPVGYQTDSNDASAVRPVSAVMEKPIVTRRSPVLSGSEPVNRPGQIKVYSADETRAGNVVRRLPENGPIPFASDNEGWSPVE